MEIQICEKWKTQICEKWKPYIDKRSQKIIVWADPETPCHAREVYDPFRYFLKVNSPRFVGELSPKVNSRPESETIILLVV